MEACACCLLCSFFFFYKCLHRSLSGRNVLTQISILSALICMCSDKMWAAIIYMYLTTSKNMFLKNDKSFHKINNKKKQQQQKKKKRTSNGAQACAFSPILFQFMISKVGQLRRPNVFPSLFCKL